MFSIPKALLALPILAAASLTIPSEAVAKGHGHGTQGAGNSSGKHMPHGRPHRKWPGGGFGGGLNDDDDDDDDDDCKVVFTPKGPVVICDTDDDDDDDDDDD
jgi:hypothetical protein